jgi:hypothetical protein
MQIRYVFDLNQPQGTFSTANLRNMFRALFENDIAPLRARASLALDLMEYPSDAAAQDVWSGTGVVVSTNSTDKQEGTYALQCVVDAAGDRTVSKSSIFDLSAFRSLKLWERSSIASSAIQFYIKDASGNESYWDVIADGVANTWKQDELSLSAPESNNGTNAVLSDIVEIGFRGLDANATYLFDTVKAIVGMTVAIEGSKQANGFYQQVYIQNNQPLDLSAQAFPIITAPSSNPRLDIGYINSSGSLAWIQGAEAASPVPDWSSLAVGSLPLCLVYCRPTMTKVVDYEDKDSFPNDGYIYADVRPFLNVGIRDLLGLIDTPSSYSGQSKKIVRVNVGETALEFVVVNFTDLADTPSSYAGEGGKYARVKVAEDGLEFVTLTTSDEKVKADIADPAEGYLDAKVDNSTIEVDTSGHRLRVKDGGVTEAKLGTAVVSYNKLTTAVQERIIKAWVSFNGKGTVSINDSYNVVSVVDNGTGSYQVNWATAFASTNYAVATANLIKPGTGGSTTMLYHPSGTIQTTTYIQLYSQDIGQGPIDSDKLFVMAIGD